MEEAQVFVNGWEGKWGVIWQLNIYKVFNKISCMLKHKWSW